MQAETPVPVPGPRVELKPIIKEIVRTQVCFPNVRLLVDKVSIITLSDAQSGNEAFHLLLTDGEKRRMYKTITSGDICEGSYLVLKQYRLERAKRLTGGAHVIYVVLEDFYSIGQDQRRPAVNKNNAFGISDSARSLQEMAVEPLTHSTVSDQLTELTPLAKEQDSKEWSGTDEGSVNAGFEEEIFDITATLPKSQSSSANTSIQKKRKRDIALGEIDPNFSSTSVPPSKRIRDRKRSSLLREPFFTARSGHPDSSNPGTCLQQRPDSSTGSLDVSSRVLANEKSSSSKESVGRKPSYGAARTLLARECRNIALPIERPLNVQPLAKFRGYQRRNDVYDVFAVVQWVGESVIKRSRMPPKRDLRIVDPSTDKKVLLSVFVEPERFNPTVGTVALIRSVTTHEWDGGMLNIYPKECEGKQWFVPSPKGLEGCDVEAMREWWKEMQANEFDEKPGD